MIHLKRVNFLTRVGEALQGVGNFCDKNWKAFAVPLGPCKPLVLPETWQPLLWLPACASLFSFSLLSHTLCQLRALQIDSKTELGLQ